MTALKLEFTNTCNCENYDIETGEFSPSEDCYGDCWELVIEDFANITQELRDSNETGWWKVSNLRLWNGEVSGYFHAKTVADIIRGMAVNGEWTMRMTAYPDRIEYSLSHHDAIGSNSTLTAISDEEREELGLY